MSKSPDKDVAKKHLWEITPARDVIIFVAVALLLWLVYLFREIFLPVLLAAILAYLFNPFVTFLEARWHCPRPVTVSFILATAVLAIIGFLMWLGPILYDQIMSLARNLPGYLRMLSTRYNIELENFLKPLETALGQLQSNPQEVLSQLFRTTGHAIGIVTLAFSTATYLFLSVILIAIYFFVFSWHFNDGLIGLKDYLPQRRRQRILQILGLMDRAIADFFRGRLVIAFIMGVLLSLGWFLTDVPYWFFLGMLTGFFNIVPYLSVVTWPIAVFLKYVESMAVGGANLDFFSIAVWPSVVYIGVQLLDGWILTPWIQSGQTNMNAATVLIVVFIGGALAGVWGLLFAIPLAACSKIFLEEVVLPPIRRWAAEQ
jgi:predicted PurR-regulated permease PerM